VFATIILNGILFGMLLSILIGPVFFVLLETSIKKGPRHAIFIDIGVLLSDVLYLVAAFFFSEKINQSINEFTYLKYVGAALFIIMGIVSIVNKKSPQKGKQIDVDGLEKMASNPVSIMRVRTYLALIGKGIGLNAINPAVLIYWIGASTYATEQLEIEGINLIYYFSATLATMFSLDLLKIYFASKLKNKLTPQTLDRISVVVGCCLIFFGLVICFQDIYV
jgi:threonine/homoserine/homoserine lactone efflux protein